MELNYIELAKNEYHNGNYDLSKWYYQFDLYYNDQNKYLSYFNISVILFKQKNFNLALHYIKNSIKINPNWYKSWRMLGDILYNLKYYEEALIAYKRTGEISILDDDLKNTILKVQNKISSLEDTEDTEDSEESDEENNSNDMEDKYNQFKKSFCSDKIQDLLKDDNLKNKILSNKTNPMIIFQDKEIQNLMNEIYKEYKKK
jgi:tetratricopeptide (TPR) repeat protein